ncbi:MAG: APC family permease [Candidatus Eremiobacteraeota bacterium]|nr:APC family permease [Candidatus Eremiobacteraeota bacterium]
MPDSHSALRRSMGLTDVALFFIIATTNLQWVAASAAAGPTSLFAWVVGCLAMFVPLCVVVVFLSKNYPQEGGMYVWSKHAFGPFAGFMTAWTYWFSTLPFFPSILYFAAGTGLYLSGNAAPGAGSTAYYLTISLGGLFLATIVNFLGLGVGKYLVNIAAVCRWLLIGLLIVLGAISWMRFGAATPITTASLMPSFDLKQLIFWAIIAFALTGPESVPFMAEEVRDPERTIPRGLAIAAPSIVGIYVLGTLAVLALIRPENTDSLHGVIQGIAAASAHFGGAPLIVAAAGLIVVSGVGSLIAWIGSNARLPFAVGLDSYLPRAFGYVHPRWRSPMVALGVQSLVAAALVILSQSGTSAKGAYDVLVSSTVLATMVPFVLMFASGIKLAGDRVWLAAISGAGLLTVVTALVLAAFPASDEPNKTLYVAKILGLNVAMLATGAAVYIAAQRGRARRPAGTASSELTAEP